MNCSEFLELYSDYRDGCLDDTAMARAVREHLRECDACMRYDAAVCRGVMALRSLNELEPRKNLVFHGINVLPDSRDAGSPLRARFAGALMVAAAIALLVWPQAEQPAESPPIARAIPAAPPPAARLPDPKPLPVREIDPPVRVFNAHMQPPQEKPPVTLRAALPD